MFSPQCSKSSSSEDVNVQPSSLVAVISQGWKLADDQIGMKNMYNNVIRLINYIKDQSKEQ